MVRSLCGHLQKILQFKGKMQNPQMFCLLNVLYYTVHTYI